MQPRPRIKHTLTFEERLAQHGARLRHAARKMTLGKEREEVLKRARQAETAASINRWLSTGRERSDQQLGEHVGKMVQSMSLELRRDHR